MHKYRASNQTPLNSVVLLLILGIISGAALGGILWAVDNYLHFYLVIAFPIFAGLIAGGLLVRGVRSGKMRSPIIGVVVGLLTGALIFVVYHYAAYYITFRNDFRDAYVANGGTIASDTDLDQVINQALILNGINDTGFVGYLKFEASQGLTITNSTDSTSSSDSGNIDLKDQTVYIYWLVEILLAGGIAASLTSKEAGQPFDEEAGDWYGKPTRLAIATVKSRKQLFKALKEGDFQAAGALLTTNEIKYPREEVLLRRSPGASGSGVIPPDVYVTVNYCQRKNRTTVQRSGMISQSELDQLTRSIAEGQPVAAKR